MRYVEGTLIGLMAGFVPAIGLAETTATTSFQVGAHIQSSCRVQAENVRFAALSSAEPSSLDGSAVISVRCTRGAYGDIQLGRGMQPHPESELRHMTGEGGRSLGYRLQLVQGDAPPDEAAWDKDRVTMTSDGRERRLTLHGRLEGGPDAPGLLTDTVTITLVY